MAKDPFSLAVGIGAGIFSFFGDESQDEATKRLARENIKYLEALQDELEIDLYHNALMTRRESSLVEGQQRAVLQSIGVTGRSELSRGLINETRAFESRKLGSLVQSASVKDQQIRAKIAENRAIIEGVDSIWNKVGNLATAFSRGVKAYEGAKKLRSVFQTGSDGKVSLNFNTRDFNPEVEQVNTPPDTNPLETRGNVWWSPRDWDFPPDVQRRLDEVEGVK